MEKKIGEISQSFEQLKFTEALTTIEQTLKKNNKQDKKQKQLSPVELRIIQSFKAGSLLSLGRHHEAAPVYQQITHPDGIAIMGKENPFLFLSIAELFGEGREKELIEQLEKNFPGFDTSKVHRFLLSCRMFSTLSKLCLKQFMVSKNNMLQLNQVYLDYLHNANKLNLIEYRRDGWYRHHPDIKNSLKLVSMFLDKCLKTAEEGKAKNESDIKEGKILEAEKLERERKNNLKVIEKGNQLKLKIAINEGRAGDAIKIYLSIREQLKIPFVFIRSILKLGEGLEERGEVYQFYLKEMQNIFRANLNFQTYTPLYDYYQQFFDFLKTQCIKLPVDISSIKAQESELPFQQLYNFTNLTIPQTLQRYYSSLLSELTYLTNPLHANYSSNKKSDYYKICLKGLLLQIIEISHYLKQEEISLKYLNEYTNWFSNTLTYSSELKKYWKIIIIHEVLRNPEVVDNDGQLMVEINFKKISLAVRRKELGNREEVGLVYEELMGLYRARVKEVEKGRRLEKGQRYISDEFVIILADYIRAYLQQEEGGEQTEEMLSRISSELEYCVEVSAYNADLKLRLMHFLALLNHSERLLEVYVSNDIKSVQMETLGYWFLRTGLEFGSEATYDYFLERMVRSYQENQRETSEYGLKALRAGELDRVEEYLSYRSNVANSYNSVLLLYLLFHRYRLDPNAHYYLLRINERINRFKSGDPMVLNADFRVMGNVLFEEYGFGEFYGLYNSREVLQREIQVYLHEHYLINNALDRPNDVAIESLQSLDCLGEVVASLQVKILYDFTPFTFQEERLQFNLEKGRKAMQRNGILLDVFKSVVKLRITNIRLGGYLLNSIKTQLVGDEINDLQKKVIIDLNDLLELHKKISYRAQIRSLVLIRRGLYECYNLLNLLRQTASKNKKAKTVKAAVENTTGRLLDEYYKGLVSVRWGERRSKGMVEVRDGEVERRLQLQGKEAKREISKYQIAYKQ